MATFYSTNEWSGYGKKNRYHNEYRLEDDTITKVKCHDFKTFDGDESYWVHDEKPEESWSVDDPDKPSWLDKYL